MSRLTRLLKKVCGASLGSERGRRGLTLNRIGSSGTRTSSDSKRWAVGGQMEAVGSFFGLNMRSSGTYSGKTETVGGLAYKWGPSGVKQTL